MLLSDVQFGRGKDKKKRKQIMYRGKLMTPNVPVLSNRPGKKKMVLASKKINGKIKYKLIHYGASSYGHNYSPEARKNYLARSGGIRNKSGELTKDDKFSPNYWSRKNLWSRNTKPSGTGRFKK